MGCGCGSCGPCGAILRVGGGGSEGLTQAEPQTFMQRLAPTVDRIRQSTAVRLGLRPYRVSLVWTRWTGEERGDGEETVLREVSIEPRPEVVDLTSVALSPYGAGILPVGSVRVQKITTRLSDDNLRGNVVPGRDYLDGCGAVQTGPGGGPPDVLGRTPSEQIGASSPRTRDGVKEPYDFFYEIVDTTQGGARRQKFRLMAVPFRRRGSFDWSVVLERVSEDRERNGQSRFGPDAG